MFHPFDKTGRSAEDALSLSTALQALSDPDATALFANAAALLNWYLEDVNWVGFYLWKPDDEELVLGPFQGLPACIRIKSGRGVCGAAFAENRTLRVDDVNAFPGHIACDSASRSELVVPLRSPNEQQPIGVLDIDSPAPARFSEEDQQTMESFVLSLEDLLSDIF